MAHTIEHFIWGYQQHFRIDHQCVADEVFKMLDQRFKPEVFLVGVRYENHDNRYQACVEPENEFWISSEAFDGALSLAESFLPSYPEYNMRQSHPVAQQRQDNVLLCRSIRDAIQQIIEQYPRVHSDIKYFASLPERIDGFFVSVVLGLQQEVISSYYSLTKDRIPLHKYRDVVVARSLIDAVINEYLGHAADHLRKSEDGRFSENRTAEELLRTAGQRFATDVAYRADPDALGGFRGFFRACNIISSTMYEQSVGVGKMIVAQEGHDSIKPRILFKGNVRLDEFRGARKMLELASRGAALHTNSMLVFGIADCLDYAPEKEDVFEVKFLSHYHWELIHTGHNLMSVKYGQPYLPKLSEYEIKLGNDLPRIFKDISKEKADLLISLIRSAEREKHGTMLIFTAHAKMEADRLKAQGTEIEPQILAPDLLSHLTPIDGAIIIDPSGVCHAIGVILDGLASAGVGDPSRGARYNSALRYVASSAFPCLAVVISEDGGVDLVPDLRPAIRRSLLEEKVREITALSEAIKIERRRYIELLDWLSDHRFYLLEEHAESVNHSMQMIEDRLLREEPTVIRIVRTPFTADPEMDVNLYYMAE